MIAGTYNAHPVPVSAAIATLTKLKTREKEIYGHLENLGRKMEEGLRAIFSKADFPSVISRQGSAFVVYFMGEKPKNWFEIARDNDMAKDLKYRKILVKEGIFHFPSPAKQGSISFAHTEKDVERTLEVTERLVNKI